MSTIRRVIRNLATPQNKTLSAHKITTNQKNDRIFFNAGVATMFSESNLSTCQLSKFKCSIESFKIHQKSSSEGVYFGCYVIVFCI